MALLLYTGVAGTGKTLYAIQKYLIPELKKETNVYTNIDGLVLARIAILYEIDLIQVERCFHSLTNPARFWEEAKQNAMVILDESQNIFNNRDWQNRDNCDCVKYLMEHRHYGHQLIFLTPHIDTLDAGVRRVAELTYKHKSFSALGSTKTVKTAVFSCANINQEPIQTFTWRHDVRIYDCYKSYFNEGTVEKKVRVHPLRNAQLGFVGLFVLIAFIISLNTLPKMMQKFNKGKPKHIVVLNNSKIRESMPVKSQAIIINDSNLVGENYRRVIR